MSPFFLRIRRAADANQQARLGEQDQRTSGVEAAAASTSDDAASPTTQLARLGAAPAAPVLPRPPDSLASTSEAQGSAAPGSEVTEPSELLDLLAQQMARRAAEL